MSLTSNRGPKKRRRNDRILERKRTSGERGRSRPRGKPESAEGAQSSSLDDETEYRAFVLEHDYHFDRDFPELYRRVKVLIRNRCQQEGHDDAPEEELRFLLGEIVYVHYRRRKNVGYKENVTQCMLDADNAAQALHDLSSRFLMLDHEHLEMFAGVLEQFAASETFRLTQAVDTNGRVLAFLRIGSHLMKSVYLALQIASGENPKAKRGRGQCTLPYTIETYRLIELWFYLTGTVAVTPRGKSDDKEQESGQPSTEFVRLCLRMIDPKITLANVQTCIKRALEIRNRNIDFILKYLSKFDVSNIALMARFVAESAASQEKPEE